MGGGKCAPAAHFQGKINRACCQNFLQWWDEINSANHFRRTRQLLVLVRILLTPMACIIHRLFVFAPQHKDSTALMGERRIHSKLN